MPGRRLGPARVTPPGNLRQLRDDADATAAGRVRARAHGNAELTHGAGGRRIAVRRGAFNARGAIVAALARSGAASHQVLARGTFGDRPAVRQRHVQTISGPGQTDVWTRCTRDAGHARIWDTDAAGRAIQGDAARDNGAAGARRAARPACARSAAAATTAHAAARRSVPSAVSGTGTAIRSEDCAPDAASGEEQDRTTDTPPGHHAGGAVATIPHPQNPCHRLSPAPDGTAADRCDQP